MAPSGSRRIGRTLRRSRRGSDVNGNSSARATAGAGPLQAIGENTVVDLTEGEVLVSNASLTLTSPSPKKRKNKKKKKRLRDSMASTSVQFEKKRKQQLETLLDDLETQVQEKCDELVAEAEKHAQELEMELKVQLVFLPEAVRQMPWKTFVGDFGGDLQNVIHSFSQTSTQPSPLRTRSSLARHSIVAATPCSVGDPDESEEDDDYSVRNRRLSAFTTPLDRRRAVQVPSTVLRTARKGETTYSARGSPIMPDTVAKAPAGSLVATFDEAQELTTCLQLDSERVVDLTRPEELSEKSRGEATSKLKALQAKVAQLLRQIDPCSS